MNADFHVISKRPPEPKTRWPVTTIIAGDFNVSSQGKAEFKGPQSEWVVPHSGSSEVKVCMDSDLQNIWAKTTGGRVFCLRAGGRDQEVIDYLIPKLDGHKWEGDQRCFVRGIGDGESMLCFSFHSAKANTPGEIKFLQIKFDNDGYHLKSCTLSDVLQESIPVDEEGTNIFALLDSEWKCKKTNLDCVEYQFPSQKTIPMFNAVKQYNPKLPLPEGRTSYEDKATIVWNFENGFEVIETPSIEELEIVIPGNNRITAIMVNMRRRFRFSSKASEFGTAGYEIIGIRPDGDNLPEPRFPRTMQELEFREDTKRRISYLEGEIEELRGMFRDHVQSHD